MNVFAAEVVNLRCEHMESPLGIDAVSPRLSWQINDSRQGAVQKAYRILVSTDSIALLRGNANVWNSGKIKSDQMLVNFSGTLLKPFTRYYWCVEVWNQEGKSVTSSVTAFETGFMQTGLWKGSWISDGNDINYKPAPYFRKVVDVSKKVKSARAYIAVGGLYELYLNGSKVGNHRLDPMYTRFDRRTLYVTHDVTALLQNGKNAIGVILGNGWYNHQSTAVWNFHQAPWRARPAFCMDLRITYEDGSVETVTSGNDWKTSTGSVIFNSIYTAEHIDARLEQLGWNTTNFDDSKWTPATLRSAPSRQIVAQVLCPIRNVEEVKPQKVVKINDSTYVFDLGRNIAGVSQFTVEGAPGTTFRLKHGERLYPNGRVDLSNIDVHYRPNDDKDPFQTDIYILSGKGTETFMPHFNYKGFQYVEVACNRPVKLTQRNLTGYFMHSDVPSVGNINSSNPMLNKLWWATNNSYLSNLMGYPTDCPQREKNGWTGDAHIAVETGLYNFDGITIYEKWLADHRDEQQPNGVLPAIVPTCGWGYQWANGPDWTSTIAIIPWNIYMFYGDSKLLADCYENIKRYVDHIADLSPSGLTSWGLGDWVPVKSKSPVEFTSSVYYFTDVSILARAAKLFGKQAAYEKYSALTRKIKAAINAKYLNTETCLYGNGTQTEMSVALHWCIVPDELKNKVAANLAKRVEADHFSLDVGLLGTKTILNALIENGYADVAYKLASNETCPSWGWWIVNGATTLYENWPLDAKSDISKNHIMFGEIGAWMYKALGGIYPDEQHPGFKNVVLKPSFPDGLESFESSHQSPYGEIVSKWKKQNGTIQYTVTIPANSTATLFLPQSFGYALPEGAKKQQINQREEFISLKSGTYTFEIKPNPVKL
ncbi:MAG: glycoside hydrolase family 78 protein [Bacteroidota bacterium]|nr:glycoside hydrolase family 78 protein [Bacteroidota bacterium]